MRIFNEEKTEQLNKENLDLNAGHLVEDKLFVKHHAATAEVPAKSAYQVAENLRLQGNQITTINGKLYKVIKVYDNGGRHVEEIKDQLAVPAVDAWDECENIYVYKLYTPEELLELKKQELRLWRQKYLEVISWAAWYDGLSPEQKTEVKQLRQALKDVTDTMVKPIIPAYVQAEIKP